MSASLYLWKLDIADDEIAFLLAQADNPREAAEKVALNLAAVNPDPNELLIERHLWRKTLPIHLEFSEGVVAFKICVRRGDECSPSFAPISKVGI